MDKNILKKLRKLNEDDRSLSERREIGKQILRKFDQQRKHIADLVEQARMKRESS